MGDGHSQLNFDESILGDDSHLRPSDSDSNGTHLFSRINQIRRKTMKKQLLISTFFSINFSSFGDAGRAKLGLRLMEG